MPKNIQSKAWSSHEIEKMIEEMGGGTEVIANPTLEGTEDILTALQIGEEKYKLAESLWKLDNPVGQGGTKMLMPKYKTAGNNTQAYMQVDESSWAIAYKVNSSTPQIRLGDTYTDIRYLRQLSISNLGYGTAGQVLGKDPVYNTLAWLDISGGTKLYKHTLFNDDSGTQFVIITNSKTPLTYDSSDGAFNIEIDKVISAYYYSSPGGFDPKPAFAYGNISNDLSKLIYYNGTNFATYTFETSGWRADIVTSL